MKFFSNERNIINTKHHKLIKLEDAVDAIFDINHLVLGQNIFDSTVQSINILTDANIVFIGTVDEFNHSVTTISLCCDGEILPNRTFSFLDAPCAKILNGDVCCFPSGVSELFNSSRLWSDYPVEAYVGVPFNYAARTKKGVIVIMFNQPIDNCKLLSSLLRVYGIQVAQELEHIHNTHLLEEQHEHLNSLFEQLTKKNTELDKYIKEVETARIIAEESNQLKTAFLANLSHEVRTPMNVMLGFAELLKSEGLNHDERIEYIDIINQNGMQLLKIMDNLIDISKFQSRKVVSVTGALRINDLLDRFYLQYKDYIKMMQKDINLQLVKGLPDDNDLIIADYEGVSKVLNQLLDNAIKFTSSGVIKLGYRIQKTDICFFVFDTGVGVPEGMENKIFDIFRQVDLRQSRDFGGNGLGLAIARKFTELMGGELWLDRAETEGTSFCFKIPYIQSSSKLTDKSTSAN